MEIYILYQRIAGLALRAPEPPKGVEVKSLQSVKLSGEFQSGGRLVQSTSEINVDAKERPPNVFGDSLPHEV